MAKAVISTIGHDRPGLVSDITAIANEHQLNIEDSRMTVLGGEFAVLMALEGPDDVLARFDEAMQSLCNDDNLAYIFRETTAPSERPATRPYRATIVALDHPGIVYAIAQFFSARSINIRDLHTDTSPAPHTGTPIFNVTLIAEIPSTIRVHELKEDFETFCATEDLDGALEASKG